MVIGEFEVDDIISRFGGFVRDVQCAVFVVGTLDFGLAWAFDGK